MPRFRSPAGSGLPGETWRRAWVVLNSDEVTGTEFSLPEGRWQVAMDKHSPSSAWSVSGKVIVQRKSGLVLCQR